MGLTPIVADAAVVVSGGSGAGFVIAGVSGIAAAYGAAKKPWKKRLHLVERENLKSELEDLDVDAVEECSVCGDEIQPEEIGVVVREEDGYRIVCDDSECLDSV